MAVFQYRAQPTRNFCRQRGVDFDCLGDPERAAYREVGLERGSVREWLGPQLLPGIVRNALSGSAPGIPKGDVTQRPGTFVVDSAGRVVLAHYNRDSSDNPAIEDVLAAVRSAASVA